MKIVFCIPSTTKNRDDNNKSLEIITSLSKIRNYKNKPDIYIGYDIDDPIYIQKEKRDNIYPELNIKWYSQNVDQGNVVKIWNNLTEQAVKDGYEYIMLIGDDIIYPDNEDWINIFCESLNKNNMYGISSGDSGNSYLPMTQFMITYKHYELFNYAFNPQLKNWYCDNYLGELYPNEYINYFEDIKLWNSGGKPRYTPENHKLLYKKLLIQDKPKFNKILYHSNNIKNKKICEDFIIDWVERNNGLCITRNIINFNNKDDYKENKYICITGYDNIINILFTKLINIITKPFVLIIVETDNFNLTETILNNSLLKHIYCWNKPFNHEKITSIPIGLNYSRQYDSIENFLLKKQEIINKKLLCINFSPETNKNREYLLEKAKNEWYNFCDICENIQSSKKYIKKSCIEGKIYINVTNPLYYDLINKYKFIISPSGAGQDCHRTWEALYLDTIPIVLSSSINELYKNLPILVIDKWNDINQDFLNKKYLEIKNNKKKGLYDMNKLYMKYWLNKIENNIIDNENYKINPIHFITYGDSKFQKSKNRLLKEAEEFNIFQTVKGYGPQDLSGDFINKYKNIFKNSRGGGYWIWRPYILRKAINNINDGEYLIYLDAGCTLNKYGKNRFYQYIDKLENSKNNYGILSFQMTNDNFINDLQKEKWWTTSQIFDIFNIKPVSEIGESGQYLGGVLIMKKNKHLLEYLNKYEDIIYNNELLITDIYNHKKQHDEFKSNRHEQSISSILRKINGSEIIYGDETYITPFGSYESLKYPFWATRIRE